MQPFYFGSSERPLFGAYHPPGGGPMGSYGAVLCPPLWRESLHAHGVFRRLSERLAGEGLHVLRFEYSGCGDSAGAADEATVERWIEDVDTAVEELRATGGVRRVGLVGLRFGAALATLASRERDDVRSLVLWEPVTDGRAYVEGLLEAHRRTLREEHPPVPGDDAGADGQEAMGYPFPGRLQEEIAAVDLRDVSDPGAKEGGIVASRPDEDARAICEAFREAGVDFELRDVPTEGRWERIDHAGRALLPGEAWDAVTELVRRRS